MNILFYVFVVYVYCLLFIYSVLLVLFVCKVLVEVFNCNLFVIIIFFYIGVNKEELFLWLSVCNIMFVFIVN